jgi:hypothetical protein
MVTYFSTVNSYKFIYFLLLSSFLWFVSLAEDEIFSLHQKFQIIFYGNFCIIFLSAKSGRGRGIFHFQPSRFQGKYLVHYCCKKNNLSIYILFHRCRNLSKIFFPDSFKILFCMFKEKISLDDAHTHFITIMIIIIILIFLFLLYFLLDI